MDAFPIRPLPESDSRFTTGLIFAVRDVLKSHGYAVAQMSDKDFVELRMSLYGFLYGERQS